MRLLAIGLLTLTLLMQTALAQDEPKLKKTEASGISEHSNSMDSLSFKSERRSTIGSVHAKNRTRIKKESKQNEILLVPMVTAATVLVAGEFVWKLCQQELAVKEADERNKQLQKPVQFPAPLP